ncbi:MAG: c-type cytochrome [Halioglobus sp.]|nr:c-type cytochrome [Halioglobus sp.]
MNTNEYDNVSQHGCTGECYEEWRAATGGVVAIAQAQVEARAQASPEELGAPLYAGCVACHGADGGGGVGPQLAGQSVDELAGALLQYRNGETRGAQSVLMWSQAREMSDDDINNLAAYISTF